MTSRHRNEYMLKGLFLGLWSFYALQVPAEASRAWTLMAWALGWVGAGLGIGIVLAVGLQFSRGLRLRSSGLAFPLLLLLESPTFIYAGISIGLLGGVLSGREFSQPLAGSIAASFALEFSDIKHDAPTSHWLEYFALGGLLLGYGLYRMRQVEDRSWRFWMGIVVAGASIYLCGESVAKSPALSDPGARYFAGTFLLIGLPFFYLLTFCGDAEESEVEAMAFSAALGIAISLMGTANKLPGVGPFAPYLIPLAFYCGYVGQIMPGLRVYKYVLRASSDMHRDRLREAIQLYHRALELDPSSRLARRGMHILHNRLTLKHIERDPSLIELLDFSICLDQAEALLMTPPTVEKQKEAEQFLDLVERKQPRYLPRVDYLRTISYLHAKRYEEAAETLGRLLDPEAPGYRPEVRKLLLYDAWDLALRAHPKMVERLGWPELNKAGRRMEAIAAVERKSVASPEDPVAKEYRTMLYSQLGEAEFVAAIDLEGKPSQDFAYELVEQLGLALVDNPDSESRERGMGYLRMAGRGLLERAPGIFFKLAQVHEKQGDEENQRRALESAKRAGLSYGPRALAKEQRHAYFESLRKLADLADRRGEFELAIEELRQYQTDGGTAALETYRRLAELYGKLHDAMNALLMTETGLTYDSTDADLLKKKDSFYYSVEPERLEKVKDRVVKWFDVAYCIQKSTSVLNSKDAGLDSLDWAAHLAQLAMVMKPTSNAVRLLGARVLLRRGDRDAGLQILEDLHYDSEKGSGDDEDAWFAATKLLGQLYLDELGKADLALHCFLAYKSYHKSGADTLYQMARCYEAMGDASNAARFYAAVTGYEGHPLYWDAKQAVGRLKGE